MILHKPNDHGAPVVSVVVPAYNRSALIGFTLSSLSAEAHPSVQLQVIVVDDGSSDGTAARVSSEFPDVLLIEQAHCGAPGARNRGLAEARGDYVVFIDSDDLVEPGFFASRIEALRRASEADGAYGPYAYFTGDGEFTESAIVPQHTDYPMETTAQQRSHLLRLLQGWFMGTGTIVWRAEAVRRVGGQDERLAVNQDVDLIFRILLTGHGLVGAPGPKALYRVHAGERQGMLGNSEVKVASLLELRLRFVDLLEAAGLLDDDARRALGVNCFHYWAAFRRRHADVARRFLALSRALYPELQLAGRWPLRLLSHSLGAARAMEIRDAVSTLLGRSR
jgi:glycosyltransferase involved in cell wall biosynthesis